MKCHAHCTKLSFLHESSLSCLHAFACKCASMESYLFTTTLLQRFTLPPHVPLQYLYPLFSPSKADIETHDLSHFCLWNALPLTVAPGPAAVREAHSAHRPPDRRTHPCGHRPDAWMGHASCVFVRDSPVGRPCKHERSQAVAQNGQTVCAVHLSCSSQRMLQVDRCMRFPALSKQLPSGHHAGCMLLHMLRCL